MSRSVRVEFHADTWQGVAFMEVADLPRIGDSMSRPIPAICPESLGEYDGEDTYRVAKVIRDFLTSGELVEDIYEQVQFEDRVYVHLEKENESAG